jgi:ribosomal peptide maturation radical SAM protein 1
MSGGSMARVALVCMPYYKAEVPPIALGLLKAILRERGIAVDLHHLNLWFADSDYAAYREINDEVFFHGEWIFSHALWDEPPPATLAEVTAALQDSRARFCLELAHDGGALEPTVARPLQSWAAYSRMILAAVERVEPFLARCLDEIDWAAYELVGFTSTFQQNVASLALAKRLKQRFPNLYIMFGGANCDGVMGEAMFRAFPFIDGVCLAEGDEVFPDFVEALLAGAPARPRDGLLDRRLATSVGPTPASALRVLPSVARRPPFAKLDALPFPDYDDYFEQFATTSFAGTPTLVYFETSRGCWYGQKQHCTFCGVNGSAIDFRTKSPARAVEEIRWIHDRYCDNAEILAATDNIMPADYPRTMLPQLEALGLDTRLFYETKSNLRKPAVAQYQRAGVKHVQPGIESLSSPVLKLMKKGVTALQNIQTLKWCRQYNIRAKWNVLYGFPGETAADYAGQAELFAKLHHLHAPISCVPIRIDRFSPYQERPQEFGITGLRAHPGYRVVYRELSDDLLEDLAYCFVGDYASKAGVAAYDQQLYEAVMRWQARADEAALFFLSGDRRAVVGDFRDPQAPAIHLLEGARWLVHAACDRIHTRGALAELLDEHPGTSSAQLDAALARLLELDLLIEEDERYLSLAFEFDEDRASADAYFPPASCWPWLGQMLAMLEQPPGSSVGSGLEQRW